MKHRILWAPAILAACMLAVTPAEAQFGSLLRKVTTPTPKPSEDDNGGCPKGKKGNSAGRKVLGGVLDEAIGSAASRAGVYSYVPIAETLQRAAERRRRVDRRLQRTAPAVPAANSHRQQRLRPRKSGQS